MQLTSLLSLYAVITAFFGLALLGFPSQLMGVYGASLDTLATILSRFIGGLFAGLAVMAWMARAAEAGKARNADRKSTRLNSSHSQISYAVFCLKKKNTQHINV